MKQSDLDKRRLELQSSVADNEEDFEEIVVGSRSPISDENKISLLSLDSLVEYEDKNFEELTGRPQPFKLHNTETLESLAKSIKENGVINPIIVSPLGNGKYKILAGRNRARASRLCGKENIPAIIRSDVDEISAAIIMLDTNLEQRPNLSYSEKAYAYKMRVDLQKKQGKRSDIEGAEKKDTLTEVGKENNQSRRTVAYLIRLTFLIPQIIEMVDEGAVGFKLGVAMSYLCPETQNLLYNEILLAGYKVKQSQIKELKVLEDCGTANAESVSTLFNKPQIKAPTITICSDALSEYADILTDKAQIEKLFIEFLKAYRLSATGAQG